jgi:hypothetical protein
MEELFMSTYFQRSFFFASLALAAWFGNVAAAKPPDLPSASREAVSPQVEQIPVMPRATKATVPMVPMAKIDPDGRVSGARRLYLIGEHCRRVGDLDMAVNCYHEVDLLSPHSAYARKARRRLHEIEAKRSTAPTSGDAEEQEIPRPMPRFLLPEKITIELEPAHSAPDQASPPAQTRIPVLHVPLPPRNLTIYVEEPESY